MSSGSPKFEKLWHWLYCHVMLIQKYTTIYLCIAPYAVFIESKKKYFFISSKINIIYGQILKKNIYTFSTYSFFIPYSYCHFSCDQTFDVFNITHCWHFIRVQAITDNVCNLSPFFTGMAFLRYFCYHYNGHRIKPYAHPEYFPLVSKILI